MTKPVCVKCGNADAVVSVDLVDEFGRTDDVFQCNECEETFTIADVEDVLATWAGWIAWLRSHPGFKAE